MDSFKIRPRSPQSSLLTHRQFDESGIEQSVAHRTWLCSLDFRNAQIQSLVVMSNAPKIEFLAFLHILWRRPCFVLIFVSFVGLALLRFAADISSHFSSRIQSQLPTASQVSTIILFHKPAKTGSSTIGQALVNSFVKKGFLSTKQDGKVDGNLADLEARACREHNLVVHAHLRIEDSVLLNLRRCARVIFVTSIRSPEDRLLSAFFHGRKDLLEDWVAGNRTAVLEPFDEFFRNRDHRDFVAYMKGERPLIPLETRFDFIFANSDIQADCERFSSKYNILLDCVTRARDNGLDNLVVYEYLKRHLQLNLSSLELERQVYSTLARERLRRIFKPSGSSWLF